MSKYILAFADGEAIEYESRFDTVEKVFNEVVAKRTLIIDGILYNSLQITRISKV